MTMDQVFGVGCYNDRAEYSRTDITHTAQRPAPGCTPGGGALAFGSTDRMDAEERRARQRAQSRAYRARVRAGLPSPRRPLSVRFWDRVDRSGGPDACWPWTGPTKPSGHGVVRYDHTTTNAHRMAWQLTKGDIPEGQRVLHDCPDGDNPACCNPSHLWLGTQADNLHDMVAKGRAHWQRAGAAGVWRV